MKVVAVQLVCLVVALMVILQQRGITLRDVKNKSYLFHHQMFAAWRRTEDLRETLKSDGALTWNMEAAQDSGMVELVVTEITLTPKRHAMKFVLIQ